MEIEWANERMFIVQGTKTGGFLSTAKQFNIMVDSYTGVQYIMYKETCSYNGYGYMSALIDAEGKPILYPHSMPPYPGEH